MSTYVSPSGNPEVWEEKPSGYFTREEWDAEHPVIVPVPTIEELAAKARTERDRRITACDWVVTRHRDKIDKGVTPTLAEDEYSAWLEYRDALRDMPLQDGFPWDGGGPLTPWPTEPSNA